MADALTALAARIAALPAGRRLVALAGPPAAGKSTAAETLAAQVVKLGRSAQVVPMDGFHLDNALLDARGLRARKGAPETFDVAGLLALVRGARAGGAVRFPAFDRNADAVVPGGVLTADVAIFEGNYLLLDEAPWSNLAGLWDLTVLLEVADATLRDRLAARWRSQGLDDAGALARAEQNDLPNGMRVLRGSRAADVILTTG